MDSIGHQIYRYVISKQKVCLFSVMRDFKICAEDAEKYLSELIAQRLIRFDFIFNSRRDGHNDGVRKIYKSPLIRGGRLYA